MTNELYEAVKRLSGDSSREYRDDRYGVQRGICNGGHP